MKPQLNQSLQKISLYKIEELNTTFKNSHLDSGDRNDTYNSYLLQNLVSILNNLFQMVISSTNQGAFLFWCAVVCSVVVFWMKRTRNIGQKASDPAELDFLSGSEDFN